MSDLEHPQFGICNQGNTTVLYVLIGPGAVGKNTLMKEVIKRTDALHQLATATTRPIRQDEQEGREHEFVTLEQFKDLIANDELFEYQEVHEGIYYGIPRRTIMRVIETGQDVISDLDVLGASIIRTEFPDDTIVIFVLPPSWEAIFNRLAAREASEKDIQDRLKRLPMEMLYVSVADKVIVNDIKERAVSELLEIIASVREGKPLSRDEIVLELQVQLSVISTHGIMLSEVTNEIPAKAVQPGKMPQETADQLVKELFGSDKDLEPKYGQGPGGGEPVKWDYDPTQHVYQMTYQFSLVLDNGIDLPDGWQWKKEDVLLAE